jgi:hypothetical protein
MKIQRRTGDAGSDAGARDQATGHRVGTGGKDGHGMAGADAILSLQHGAEHGLIEAAGAVQIVHRDFEPGDRVRRGHGRFSSLGD